MALVALALPVPARAAPGGASPHGASDAELGRAEKSFILASAELDGGFRGRLEEAPLDAQRRWADSLYRCLVLTAGHAEWFRMGSRERVEAQALRLDPAYVAAVAAHPRDWLESNRDQLPRAVAAAGAGPAGDSLDDFARAVLVLGMLEQDIQRAQDRRDRTVRDADREYRELVERVARDRDRMREALAAAASAGERFDLERFTARERERVDAEILDRQKRIRGFQEEFWSWQHGWMEKNRDVAYGTIPYYKGMAEYQSTAQTYNQRILRASEEVKELEDRRERLGKGPLPRDLEDLERPRAARPQPPSPPPAGTSTGSR